MRSNANIFALSLLAATGGGVAGYAHAAQHMGSVGAQAYGTPQQSQLDPQSTETWRAADGTIRSRPARVQPASEPVAPPPEPQPEPQPQWADPAPVQQSSAPGASYAVPGSAPAPKKKGKTPPTAQPQWQPQPQPQPQQTAPTLPQDYADPTAGVTGPSGSSQPAPGETPRYDEIGYAGIRPVSGSADQAIVAVHRSLPANSYVEVTSLDTGKTILVLVTGSDPGADHPIDLSAGAARQLGAQGDSIAVRIRTVNPPSMDKAALQAGRPAGDRADAPQVLLTALRKRLPNQPSYAAAPPRVATPAYAPPRTPAPRPVPVRTAPPAPRPAARAAAQGKYLVQVAALSSAGRAQALAQSLGGFVKPGGGLYRVQLGPFATAGEAEAARRRAAGAGYGDARVQAN